MSSIIIAVLDFIAKVIIAYAWPLVVLGVIWILKNALEKRVGGISLIKWKDWEIQFEPQVHPPMPPLRELNAIDTVSLRGTCSTSARLLDATLGISPAHPLPACITGYTDVNYRRNTAGYFQYSNGGQVWGSPANFGPTDKPTGTFIT